MTETRRERPPIGPPSQDSSITERTTQGYTTEALTREVCAPEVPHEEQLLLAGLRDGAWLDTQEFADVEYHLPGIVPEGFTLLVGAPKIGKSWLVLALALGAAMGGRTLGLRVDKRPVLYLALEDGDRRMQSRCRMLLPDEPLPAGFEYMTRIQPGSVVATIRAWLDRHPSERPLVILDTLGRAMPPAVLGESIYQRDYRIGTAIKNLADDVPGAAILVNHHDRKADSADFVERVSGSNGLAGAADAIAVLSRRRHETDGIIEVTGRDVPDGKYAVRFDTNTGTWSLAGNTLRESQSVAVARRATDRLDDRSRSIIEFVAEHGDGVRAAHVAKRFDMNEDDAGRYLRRLTASDRLVKIDRGLYGLPVPASEVSECPVDEPLCSGPPDTSDAGSNGEAA